MISFEIAAYSLCLEPRTLGKRPLPFFIFIYLYGTPGEIRTHVKRFSRPVQYQLCEPSIIFGVRGGSRILKPFGVTF